MQFLTDTDIKTAIQDVYLNDLTDEDSDLIDKAEASAIAKMKSMLGKRYDVAKVFSTANYQDKELIIEYCTTMTIYRLMARIAPRKIPQSIKDSYNEALAWLEKVASNEAFPSLPELASTADSSDKYYSHSPNYNVSEPREHYF